MKILHVIERIDDSYGGPAKSVPLLCDGLQTHGVESLICSVNYENDSNELIEKFGIEWIKAKPKTKRNKFYYSPSIKCKMEDILPHVDVIHLHSIWTYPSYVAFGLAKRHNKKIVISPRSSLLASSMKKSKVKKYIMRLIFVNKLLEYSKLLIVSSHEELNDVRALGVHQYNLIPNGIDPREWQEKFNKIEAREKLGLPTNGQIISFISRVHPRKGLCRLVDSWLMLNSGNSDPIYLFLAGPVDDAEYFEKQKRKIADAGMSSYFSYLGMLSGTERLCAFKAGDLFVLPSEFENFGMCIAESMLSKTPVITSVHTPWQDLNESKSGWCIANEELPLILKKAFDHDLKAMGEKACHYVAEKYNHVDIAKQFHECYKRI